MEGDLESDVTRPFFRLRHKTYCVVSVRIQRCPEEVSGEDTEHLSQGSTLEHTETRRRSRYSMPMPDFCCVNNCFHTWVRILMWTKDPGKRSASSTTGLAEDQLLTGQANSGPAPIKHAAWVSQKTHLILPNFKTEHVKYMTQLALNRNIVPQSRKLISSLAL